ncbi:hypothetical protein ACFQDZ_19975 [Sulfitobacter pacificus]|uniref:hypothetical protein n=1 Tax=Sulfitobacter pacificus TaxID=1499314 RepID=UPI003607B2A9
MAAERLSHEGVDAKDIVTQRTVEMMYQGQWRSLAVAAPSSVTDIETLIDGFHREHEREFNYRRDDAPVSIFRVGLTATGMVPKAELQTHEVKKNTPTTDATREVWFDGKAHTAMIFERDDLTAGAKFDGPAIVEQFDSTVVIPPRTTAEVDTYLNILIRVQE